MRGNDRNGLNPRRPGANDTYALASEVWWWSWVLSGDVHRPFEHGLTDQGGILSDIAVVFFAFCDIFHRHDAIETTVKQ